MLAGNGQDATESPKSVFVKVLVEDGKPLQLQTNLPPEARPMILWLLEQAKMLVLTNPSDQEKQRVQPGTMGLAKRMGLVR